MIRLFAALLELQFFIEVIVRFFESYVDGNENIIVNQGQIARRYVMGWWLVFVSPGSSEIGWFGLDIITLSGFFLTFIVGNVDIIFLRLLRVIKLISRCK